MLTVRKVTIVDWPHVKSVRLAALADSPHAFFETLEEAQAMSDDMWQDRVRQNAAGLLSTCSLVFDLDEVVGIAVSLIDHQNAIKAHLAAMWIAPKHRGSGIAGTLLESIVSWARNAGTKQLYARVATGNRLAHVFYSRAGFEDFGEKSPSTLSSEKEEIVMRLELDTMKQSERNKAIIRDFVDAINSQSWKKLRKLVARNFVRHSHAGGKPGVTSREDLIKFLCNELEVFPDAHEQLEDLIAEGNKVAARHRFEGTQTGSMGPFPASGKIMKAEYHR